MALRARQFEMMKVFTAESQALIRSRDVGGVQILSRAGLGMPKPFSWTTRARPKALLKLLVVPL